MRLRGGSATVRSALRTSGAGSSQTLATGHPTDRRGENPEEELRLRVSPCCPRPTPTCCRARASGADYVLANPARPGHQSMAEVIEGCDLVVGRHPRLAAGPVLRLRPDRARPACRSSCSAASSSPSAELMELSTVPIGVAAEAHRYLAEGGPANLAPAARLPLRHGAADRRGLRAARRAARRGGTAARRPATDAEPARGSGSSTTARTRPAATPPSPHALADAVDATGQAVGVPIFARLAARRARRAATTRSARSTRWSSPCSPPAAASRRGASAGGDDEAWDVARMAALDIPILQGLCLTSSRAEWEASDDGVTPLDSATQIAIPEFDGRIITVPFSFKEIDDDGLPRYVADPERCARVAGIAVNHARLRARPAGRAQGRAGAVGVPDQALPHRQRRRPRHPGLARSGCCAGCATRATTSAPPATSRGLDVRRTDTEAGDALIHALIAAGGQDEEWLTSAQLTDAHVRITRRGVRRAGPPTCPPTCATAMVEALGRGARRAVRQRRAARSCSPPSAPATSCC